MRKIYILAAVILIGCTVNAQILNIPDANFKAKLLAASPSNAIAANGASVFIKIDSNNNNEIETSEALQVVSLNIAISDIYTISGIENFTNLKSLNCSQNHIAALDVSALVNLKSLYCNLNLLSSLHLNGLAHLLTLECAENVLSQIDFADVTTLQSLSCRFNFLTALDVNNQSDLHSLNCDYNQLTTLNVGNLTQLTDLGCQSNQLGTLDLSSLVNLNSLNCSYNQLPALDLNGLGALAILNCSHNQLMVLDLAGQNNLSQLNCESNQISSQLVLSDMPFLQSVYCHGNLIPGFGFTDLPSLQILDCSSNQMASLDVSALSALSLLSCNDSPLLADLNIKNANNEPFLDFSDDPSLTAICADESQMATVENLITQYGYTNCQASSLCDLAVPDSITGVSLRVYPSPAKSILHLETNKASIVESIAIYDLLGQIIMAIPNTENGKAIDVSSLKTGIYFIKANTDKGTIGTRFIKD